MRGAAVNPELSVIIPSYNSGRKIFRCIDAIKALESSAPFEIIVVDSSADGTGEELELVDGIRLLRSSTKLYPGSARNQGAEMSSGRILCFTDADCIPESDWLKEILNSIVEKDRTLVGGPILNGTPDNLVGTAEYYSEFSGILRGNAGDKMDFFPTANTAIAAEHFRETGGFRDYEKGSDVAFGSDCRSRGIQPVFHPEIKVTHVNRTDLRGFLRNQEKLGWGTGNNRALFGLPGSWLARRQAAWPLVPLVRFTRILYRSVRDGAGQRAQLAKALPWILLGSIYFGVGFARGARDGMRARGAGQVE